MGESPLFICSIFRRESGFRSAPDSGMSLNTEQIRSTAQRVAASHGLDVVDLEFLGGSKHRTLRVFIEKNAEERRKLAETAPGSAEDSAEANHPTFADTAQIWGTRAVSGGTDQLAGVTHGDCEAFSRDFGTVLDVEDLIPGTEYTLEVSSPGLDRRLHGTEDFRRFAGMLAKVQTFEPVAGNRHWQGRIAAVTDTAVRIGLKGKGGKKSAERKAQGQEKAPAEEVEVALSNIEKASLVPEF